MELQYYHTVCTLYPFGLLTVLTYLEAQIDRSKLGTLSLFPSTPSSSCHGAVRYCSGSAHHTIALRSIPKLLQLLYCCCGQSNERVDTYGKAESGVSTIYGRVAVPAGVQYIQEATPHPTRPHRGGCVKNCSSSCGPLQLLRLRRRGDR